MKAHSHLTWILKAHILVFLLFCCCGNYLFFDLNLHVHCKKHGYHFLLCSSCLLLFYRYILHVCLQNAWVQKSGRPALKRRGNDKSKQNTSKQHNIITENFLRTNKIWMFSDLSEICCVLLEKKVNNCLRWNRQYTLECR